MSITSITEAERIEIRDACLTAAQEMQQVVQSGATPRSDIAEAVQPSLQAAADALGLVVDSPESTALRDDLANHIDPTQGASLVGFKRTVLLDAMTTVSEALSADAVSIWEFAGDVVDKPVPADPATWDWTPAFQSAITAGVAALKISVGVFTVKTFRITSSIRVLGLGSGSVLRRAANYELDNSSTVGVSTTMVDVVSHGITVDFCNLCFDGNEANQNVNTPSGALIRAADVPGASNSLLSISVRGCDFVNMTRCAIFVAGDADSAGEEVLQVSACRFINGRAGIGGGDPRSANASGFAPAYLSIGDGFRVSVVNSLFAYTKTLATTTPRDYAPNAARITSLFTTDADGGASATFAANYFYGLGRADSGYDGTINSNNGLGVIDSYTIGRDVIVDGNIFIKSYSAPVRAKSSIQRLVVSNNTMLDNKEKGVSVGPMGATVGAQEGRITVTGNIIEGADVLGIGVSGDSTVSPGTIGHVNISNNIVTGVTNVDGLTGNVGCIAVRYARQVIISGNVTDQAASDVNIRGVQVRDCTDAVVSANSIVGSGNSGIDVVGLTSRIVITGNTVRASGMAGISVTSTGSPDITVTGNQTDGSVNYGIIVFRSRYLNLVGNSCTGVTGSSRGFYVDPAAIMSVVTGNTTDASTPLFQTLSGNVSQAGNSWNPAIQYRSASPTTGTWRLGDLVYNTAPAASGVVGWVCVVAGTPGTWKSFGTIAA